jgi:hypothetical protein
MRTTATARWALTCLATSASALAQQPAGPTAAAAAPATRWTPAAEAPAGTLSHALEGQRHDSFIELAQQGDIELVFFGTTEAEMWWWPDRGREVWDREFGSLKAANFGSQGTRPASLLWRMRNGELDGFRAKLIVLQAGGASLPASNSAEIVAGYSALIDEIRLRQPRAKILLFAPLPRSGPLPSWQPQAEARQALFAELVDDETVFYTDIGERFFDANGVFMSTTWGLPANNRGTQAAAYEIWAEALQPWLDRFVR